MTSKVINSFFAIIGILVLTNSLDKILPFTIIRVLQYSAYLFGLVSILKDWRRAVTFASRDPFIWMLATLATLSCLWSSLPITSLKSGLFAILTSLFALFIAISFSLREQLNILVTVFGVMMWLTICFVLLFPGSAIHYGAHAGAWRGIYTHKNELAQTASASSILFLFAALDRPKKILPKFFVYGGFFISVFVLLNSSSMTGLLVFMASILMLPCFNVLSAPPLRRTIAILCGLLFLQSVLILALPNLESLAALSGRDLTLTGRTEIWQAAIPKILDRPIFGYGRVAFWDPSLPYQLELGSVVSPGYGPPHSHNGYIDTTLDLGLIGLCLFGLTFMTASRRMLLFIQRNSNAYALWPIAYVFYMILYNVTESWIMRHFSGLWIIYVVASFSIPVHTVVAFRKSDS